MVEYNGMKSLINAVKGSVGLQNGKLVYGFEGMLDPVLATNTYLDMLLVITSIC